jgi:hypothetical protein
MKTEKRYSHLHKIWFDQEQSLAAAQTICSREKIWDDVAMCALKRAAAHLLNRNSATAEREIESAGALAKCKNIHYRLLLLTNPEMVSMCKRKNTLDECCYIGGLHKRFGVDGVCHPEWTTSQIDAYMKARYC